MTEQARQSPPRICVIFHQQNAQQLCRFLLTLRTHANLFGALRHCVKRDRESGAITSAAALDLDCAVVKIDKMPGNRQAQAKPAKLTAGRRVSLLEWPKERSLPFDFNSDPVIS